jgi:APA family basic amino acid/polyamine antiporter
MTTDQRPFGFWTATALVIGGMIGSGIFVLPAQLAPYGWTGIGAWIAAVGGALVLAWVISRLVVAMPESTGVVAMCGDGLGPLPGVLLGWSYWVGVFSANAFISLTAIRYLGVFWPPLVSGALPLVTGAAVLIALLTLLNLRGAPAAGRFQVVTTLLKLLPLVAVVAILAGLALKGGGQFTASPHPAFDWGMLTPGVGLAFFAVVGFESAGVAAERMRDPARNVVRATMFGVSLTGLLYLLVSTGIAFALPVDVVSGANAPMALFVETFWGPAAGMAIAAFAAIAAIGCLNGWVLIQGELPLGMARAGLLPRWMARTSSRDVPVTALLLGSGLAILLVLSNADTTTAKLYDFILRLTTAATLWLYVGICLTALVKRVATPMAALGLVFAGWTLWGTGLEALGWSLVLMLTALPLYFLRGAVASEQG